MRYGDDEVDITMAIKITDGERTLQAGSDKCFTQNNLNVGYQLTQDCV